PAGAAASSPAIATGGDRGADPTPPAVICFLFRSCRAKSRHPSAWRKAEEHFDFARCERKLKTAQTALEKLQFVTARSPRPGTGGAPRGRRPVRRAIPRAAPCRRR